MRARWITYWTPSAAFGRSRHRDSRGVAQAGVTSPPARFPLRRANGGIPEHADDPRASQPASLDGVRAAFAKEKEILLGFYISGHPRALPTEAEIFFYPHRVGSRQGEIRADDPRRGRDEHQAPGEQEVRIRVRTTDNRGFFRSAEVQIFPEKWATLNDQIRSDIPMCC